MYNLLKYPNIILGYPNQFWDLQTVHVAQFHIQNIWDKLHEHHHNVLYSKTRKTNQTFNLKNVNVEGTNHYTTNSNYCTQIIHVTLLEWGKRLPPHGS